jgi:hypothetical protein
MRSFVVTRTGFIAADQLRHANATPDFSKLITDVVKQTLHQLSQGPLPLPTQNLRTDAAARYLTLDPATLADWRGQPGKGPAYRKVCGRVIYSLADLDAWLESHPLQGGACQ